MLKRDHNLNGDHGTDLIAYIYGELDERGRNVFESHLAACDECAVELGAMSDARLGVVEWRREDFEHLATPEIVIPNMRPVVVPEREKVGMFAAFIDFIAASSAFARAGVGLAAAALLVGILYFAVGPNGKNDVATVPENISTPALQKEAVPASVQPQVAEKNDNYIERAPAPQHVNAVEKRPVAPSRLVAKRMNHEFNRLRGEQAKIAAPRLNSFTDEEDTSLRLTDMFAQTGPIKK
jgi:anti-sigma factor RsiW